MRDLPLPPFFHPASASSWSYQPDVVTLRASAEDWRKRHAIRPASVDGRRVELLWVDVQRDFCFPEGSLFVSGRDGRGAVEDSARLAAFLYRNLESIGSLTLTLDSHLPHQIFFASFWTDRDGNAMGDHRVVTAAEVERGDLRPRPELATWLCNGDVDWLRKQVLFYCQRLEEDGRYQLYLWPPHCLIGTDGHAVVGLLQEARLFHALTRQAEASIVIKGDNPLTENYSALRPEVLERHDGGALDDRNEFLIHRLLSADILVIAGQAASHCVKSTVDDLIAERERRGTGPDGRQTEIYVLEDCMSSVVVRDPATSEIVVDFTPQLEEAAKRWSKAGVHLVRSTQPMSSWPGV